MLVRPTRAMVPTASRGVCVRERLRGVALLKKAEGVDDIETEAQRPC